MLAVCYSYVFRIHELWLCKTLGSFPSSEHLIIRQTNRRLSYGEDHLNELTECDSIPMNFGCKHETRSSYRVLLFSTKLIQDLPIMLLSLIWLSLPYVLTSYHRRRFHKFYHGGLHRLRHRTGICRSGSST